MVDTNTRIMIAIPCMDMVAAHFTASLYNLQKPCLTRLEMLSNSLVYDARNMLAAQAIDDNCDYVLWLDSDIIFKNDLLERLLKDVQDKDFVSALYFKRVYPTAPVIGEKITKDDGTIQYVARKEYPKDQLFTVDATGFGAAITSAKLLKALYDRYDRPFYPDLGLGEDFIFCHRAKELGFELWCDSRIKIGHIGRHVFTEKDYLRQIERE